MIAVALPGKAVFYLCPFVLLAVSMTTVRLVSIPHLLLLYGGVFGLSLISMMIDQAEGKQVSWPGLFLAIETYAPLLFLLAHARSFEPGRELTLAVARMCVLYLIVQTTVAVSQFALTGDGDFVSGTFGLVDFVTGDKTISQVNFTFTLFCMIVFLLPYVRAVRWTTAAILCGMLACAIAQSGHQTIFFLFALPTAAMQGFRIRGLLPTLGLLALTIALLLVFYPETATLAENWFGKVVLADDSLKHQVIASAFGRLAEDPKNALLGLGLGQYTSRASLFAAGYQSSVPLPAVLQGASQYFVADVLPLILQYGVVGESSAISKPYFSAISILSEIGLPLTVVFLWVVARRFLALFQEIAHTDREADGLACYCKFFIIFLTLNCFIENYLELTQAIAVPAVMYVVAQGRLRAIRSYVLKAPAPSGEVDIDDVRTSDFTIEPSRPSVARMTPSLLLQQSKNPLHPSDPSIGEAL